jgi:nucleotide-binding universal stress UspA family protein
MYKTILVPLDATEADRTILDHIVPLAKLFHSRLVLLHVADGWAARTYGPDAVSPEVRQDKVYLEHVCRDLRAQGVEVEAELAYGDPVTEIVGWVRGRGCDLIAMSTHGHRFLGELILGETANRVQHQVNVPVLLLKVP